MPLSSPEKKNYFNKNYPFRNVVYCGLWQYKSFSIQNGNESGKANIVWVHSLTTFCLDKKNSSSFFWQACKCCVSITRLDADVRDNWWKLWSICYEYKKRYSGSERQHIYIYAAYNMSRGFLETEICFENFSGEYVSIFPVICRMHANTSFGVVF